MRGKAQNKLELLYFFFFFRCLLYVFLSLVHFFRASKGVESPWKERYAPIDSNHHGWETSKPTRVQARLGLLTSPIQLNNGLLCFFFFFLELLLPFCQSDMICYRYRARRAQCLHRPNYFSPFAPSSLYPFLVSYSTSSTQISPL